MSPSPLPAQHKLINDPQNALANSVKLKNFPFDAVGCVFPSYNISSPITQFASSREGALLDIVTLSTVYKYFKPPLRYIHTKIDESLQSNQQGMPPFFDGPPPVSSLLEKAHECQCDYIEWKLLRSILIIIQMYI